MSFFRRRTEGPISEVKVSSDFWRTIRGRRIIGLMALMTGALVMGLGLSLERFLGASLIGGVIGFIGFLTAMVGLGGFADG